MKLREIRVVIRRTCDWPSITVVVGVSLVSCAVLGSTLCSLSTLLVYVATALHASVVDVARITAGFVFAMTVATPLVGWCCGRMHPAVLMMCGTLLAGASYLFASGAQSVLSYFVAVLLCGIGVSAATYVPATVLITRWVLHRRGLAFACLLAASALGAAIFPALANYLSSRCGWSGALRWLGGSMVLLCVPVLAALRLLCQPDGELYQDTQAVSTVRNGYGSIINAAFVRLTMLQMLAGLSYMSVYFSIVPFLIDVGYAPPLAAKIFGGVGLASVCGFFVAGMLADRYGARRVLLAGLLVCASSTLFLLLTPSTVRFAAMTLFVIGWGGTFNISSQLAPILLIEALGTQQFAVVLGLTNFFTGLVSALGPISTGLVHDHFGGYAWAFAVAAGLMALSTLPLALCSSLRSNTRLAC